MSEEFTVKATTKSQTAADAANSDHKSTLNVDTEEIKCSSHIDDGVSRLRLCPRGKLDDLLGGLEELRHSRPWTRGSRTLEHKKRDERQVESHVGINPVFR